MAVAVSGVGVSDNDQSVNSNNTRHYIVQARLRIAVNMWRFQLALYSANLGANY
jgi:hypothetical protein